MLVMSTIYIFLSIVGVFFGGFLVLLLGIFVFMDLMMIFYVGWQCLPIYPVILMSPNGTPLGLFCTYYED